MTCRFPLAGINQTKRAALERLDCESQHGFEFLAFVVDGGTYIITTLAVYNAM